LVAALFCAAQAATPVAPLAAPAGDAVRGQQRYAARCGGCHSPKMNRVGPRHYGVFGRRAGGVADYHYSDALKKSGLTWDAPTLDKWLAGPPKLVPGTRMGISVSDAKDRQDIIAYLATLKE
jgi:cytochrome c